MAEGLESSAGVLLRDYFCFKLGSVMHVVSICVFPTKFARLLHVRSCRYHSQLGYVGALDHW